MEEEKISAGRLLGMAVLWTAVAAVWLTLFIIWLVFREFAPAILGVLAGAALILSILAGVLWWRSYLDARKSEKTEHRGGKKHER